MDLSDETPHVECDGVSEQEEKVAEASSGSSTSDLSHSEATTPLVPPCCLSKELLEQMATLDLRTRYPEVTVPKPFGCFYLMRLVERSIQVGTSFSPKLFVPKEIWQQDRVKLAGVPLKVEIFQQLKQRLEKMIHALPLSSDAAKADFIEALDALLDFAQQERLHLIRSFPFLPQDQSHDVLHLMQRESSNATEEQRADVGNPSSIGKLTNLAFGFGRMVKKQAVAAVERAGAAPSILVTVDKLDEYATVLCTFFHSTWSIGNLLGLQVDASGTQFDSNAATGSLQLDSATLKKLEDLALFLDEVVVELVMRDVHSLLETYLQTLTRQFGEFSVDQALLKRQPSVSA
uniref:Uncharacterized protein n=1 Tax=Peronospora matthiolae TaxID=2874970 RepID=A0AAV1U0H0_9STRA